MADFEKLINDNLSEKTDVKNQLKDFIDMTKKESLEPLSKAINANEDFDEKLESDMSKKQIIDLLTAMKAKLTPATDTPEARKEAYRSVYAERGKAYVFGVQAALKLMGFDLGAHQIDSEYGSKTRNAIQTFQKWKGLMPDGYAGLDTISKILEVGLDAKYDGTVGSVVAEEDTKKSTEFYTTHTEFTEEQFGGVKNKIYKIDVFADRPAVIQKDTVIQYAGYYIFSNGAVYNNGKDGKGVYAVGTIADFDKNGVLKEKAPVVATTSTDTVAVADSKNIENTPLPNDVKEQVATYEQLQLNESKIWEKCIAGFTLQWQKDWLKTNYPNGVQISYYGNGLSIQKSNNTIFTLPYSEIGGSKDAINVKKFIDTTRVKMSEIMDKEHDQLLIEKYLEGKPFLWTEIFTTADLHDPVMKVKIEKFKGYFKKSNGGKGDGMDISDVSIYTKNGTKKVEFDMDNDGSDQKWTNNYIYQYSNVFSPDGTFNKQLFTSKLRNTIINDLFNASKYTKEFTNLNPLDLT